MQHKMFKSVFMFQLYVFYIYIFFVAITYFSSPNRLFAPYSYCNKQTNKQTKEGQMKPRFLPNPFNILYSLFTLDCAWQEWAGESGD